MPEWRLMAVLGEGQPKTQRELVEATRMDKVTVNRAAKALADRQLIAREAHEVDGRSHHSRSSPKPSVRCMTRSFLRALASEAQLESNISATERATLLAILAKLTAAAEEYG